MLTLQERERLQLNALAALAEAIPQSDPQNWSLCSRLTGHIQHIFSEVENPQALNARHMDAAIGGVRVRFCPSARCVNIPSVLA